MEGRPAQVIPQLGEDPSSPFPDPSTALDEPDGLLAWGGDLNPNRLAQAYRLGIFPWYSEHQPILWWSPGQRCVIEPGQVHVSRRMARLLRQKRFSITADQAFSRVISGCALPRDDQPGTWITPQMIEAYGSLHRIGLAHSIEAWDGDTLAGGLYGLAIGRMFFGESMFSAASNASKVVLVSLCRRLKASGYLLLDCQVSNPHLESMGAVSIGREEFLSILKKGIELEPPKQSFAELFEEQG